jgi:hypothetical protein
LPPLDRRFVPKLTREQARFIIWCLAYDRIQRKANGLKNHSYGLLTKLGKTFGVTRECIVQINKRRTWRSIYWPKPKQLFFAKKQDEPGMLPRDAIQRAQDFFQQEATKAIGYYHFLKELTHAEKTREEVEELERRLQATQREIRSLIVEMSNQAFKNLPYFHAKASPKEGRPAEPAGCRQADVSRNRRRKPRETDMDEAGSEGWSAVPMIA